MIVTIRATFPDSDDDDGKIAFQAVAYKDDRALHPIWKGEFRPIRAEAVTDADNYANERKGCIRWYGHKS